MRGACAAQRQPARARTVARGRMPPVCAADIHGGACYCCRRHDLRGLGNAEGGLERHLQMLVEFLDQDAADVTARDVILRHGATIGLVGDLLCALLWRFGCAHRPLASINRRCPLDALPLCFYL